MRPFLRPRHVSNPDLRIVVFHHAGGSASTYYRLAGAMPERWELLLYDLPGRGQRHAEAPISCMRDVVAQAMADLAPWLDRPLAIFGHSYGAALAGEVGRACERLGRAPVWVGVSGRMAPSNLRETRRLHELDDAALLAELVRLGGMPPRILEEPAFVAQVIRIARADLAAVETHLPEPNRRPSRFPIGAFSGDSDPFASPRAMRGWQKETSAGFNLREFTGGHFYFLDDALVSLSRSIVADINCYGLVAAV